MKVVNASPLVTRELKRAAPGLEHRVFAKEAEAFAAAGSTP